MPLPAGYKPREGDVVRITGVVLNDYFSMEGESLHVAIGGASYHRVFVPLDHVLGLEQLHLEIGDRVIADEDAETEYTVKAIDGDFAWLCCGTPGAHQTVHVKRLERVVQPETNADDSGQVLAIPNAPESA